MQATCFCSISIFQILYVDCNRRNTCLCRYFSNLLYLKKSYQYFLFMFLLILIIEQQPIKKRIFQFQETTIKEAKIEKRVLTKTKTVKVTITYKELYINGEKLKSVEEPRILSALKDKISSIANPQESIHILIHILIYS